MNRNTNWQLKFKQCIHIKTNFGFLDFFLSHSLIFTDSKLFFFNDFVKHSCFWLNFCSLNSSLSNLTLEVKLSPRLRDGHRKNVTVHQHLEQCTPGWYCSTNIFVNVENALYETKSLNYLRKKGEGKETD